MDHNHIYNLFLMAYGDIGIIYDLAPIYLMLIIPKFVYSFFKKEIKIFKFSLPYFNNYFNFAFIFFVKSNDLSSNNISFIFQLFIFKFIISGLFLYLLSSFFKNF